MAPQRKEINAEAARQGYEKVTTINGNNL